MANNGMSVETEKGGHIFSKAQCMLLNFQVKILRYSSLFLFIIIFGRFPWMSMFVDEYAKQCMPLRMPKKFSQMINNPTAP